ncbi:hypothetical protein B0T21DRAFT_112739 [Apiosordaria backusii]|uniref:Uncharacterized protein n=1 Tax=Apiosordaria backusii TaxID=314023 RepID=A0AA39ZS24_9PEZI|nr:hypothetical protein B0T21DRAFT_112739 [Apiosordaria backusii]
MPEQCLLDCFAEPGELQPNPDIGGTGVLIGFLGTAWFVVGLVVLYYLFALDPSKSPYWTPDKRGLEAEGPGRDTDSSFVPNVIDEVIISWSRLAGNWLFGQRQGNSQYRWLWERLSRRSRWEKAFRRVILSMCDVQLLTGLGILLSAYLRVSCYVSAYHWQLVVYLAWLSNLTHVACLTVLRGYLHHYPRERNTRLFCMTLLWLGLFPALVPTLFFNWGRNESTAAHPASDTKCFFT